MLEATRTALEGSIRKWEKIVAGTGVDMADENCPLCQLFENCQDGEGCPVDNETGYGCEGSPYDNWSKHQSTNHPEDWRGSTEKVSCSTCKKLAQAELDFLKSLRPEE